MLHVASEADVNRRVPVIELVKHYHIQGLILCGSTLYRGVCPFCSKPEFQVMPIHALWLCFSCGRGGTTFDLVVKLEEVSVKEALGKINSWLCGESTIGLLVCL
jgi:DNA primase